MTPHTIALTFADESTPSVIELKASDPVHAILRTLSHLPTEYHARLLRINVSSNASELSDAYRPAVGQVANGSQVSASVATHRDTAANP